MGFIYKINFPNGKSYIGQTTKTVEERLKAHLRKSNKCVLVRNALQKYKDCYEIETLVEINDKRLDEYEIKFIKLYDTLCPHGYNLQQGGNGGIPSEQVRENMRKAHSNRVVHEQWRKAISDGLKGHKHSQETIAKLSERRKENPGIISEETRDKMRISLSSIEVRQNMSLHRRKQENEHLPMYVQKINKKYVQGYKVVFPGYPEKSFTSAVISDQEKLKLTLQYYYENYKEKVQRLNGNGGEIP